MGLLNLSTGVVALVLRRRDDVRAEAAPLVFEFFLRGLRNRAIIARG